MPFTRKLRTRFRRLPKPPTMENKIDITENKRQEILTAPPVTNERPVYIDDKNLNKFTLNNPETEISVLSEEKLLDNLKSSLNGKKSVLNEIDDILKEGAITEGLTKIVPEPISHDDVDYSKIRQNQYSRAVKDYKAAGKTFSDSGLYSNASISYTCAVLAKLLETASVQKSYTEFQKIIEIIQDKQIIRSSVFSILTNLFESLAKKDKSGIQRQLDKLHLIETFSTDDQELINDSIKFLKMY